VKNTRLKASITAAVILMGAVTENAFGESDAAAPDLIMINGHVVTMDGESTIAEAVAISGRKISAVGLDSQISALAGAATRTIDLGGRTLTPGIIDTHNHFAWSASSNLAQLDLEYPAVSSIAEIREQLRAAVRDEAPGRWLFGYRWDAGKLAEQRDIVAADLDQLSPENPVWLVHTSSHYGVANSKAMSLAGINADTPDPEGGVIARGDDGLPTGIFTDQAMELIHRVIPEPTTQDYIQAVKRYVGDLNAEGITTIKDPEIYQDHWDAYEALEKTGDLSVRVFTLWRVGDTVEEAERLRDRIAPMTDPTAQDGERLLVSGGVKIYIDGSGTARTAWVHDDWNLDFTGIDRGNTGLTYLEPDLLFQQIRLFHEAGIHIGAHAIGDRAIDFTLESYERVLKDRPVSGLRHSIIHCNLPTDHAMDLMVKLQKQYDAAYPEVQPAFLWWIGDAYIANFGAQRSPRVLPLKTFEERGIRWAGSSDYDVSPYRPSYAFWAAAAREPLLGTWGKSAWGSEQAVDLQASLRAYTATAARQVFMEDLIGTIEVGKLADLVVWDRQLYAVATQELKDVQALLTLMGGKEVFRAADF
jgi:predicted amidohydrolase YtcJ